MIRISELSLPLDAPDGALRAALLQRLRLHDDELLEFTVFKRSYDDYEKQNNAAPGTANRHFDYQGLSKKD